MSATPLLRDPLPDPPPAAAVPSVPSETAPLRRVLLHRPGDELRSVDGGDPGRMLFSAPVAVDDAQADHDLFAATLRARGVEVVYLRPLLVEAVADPAGRAALLERALPGARGSVRRRLGQLRPEQLADALIAGMSERDLSPAPVGADAQLLAPLPNLMFTRDPSAWIGSGVVVGTMAGAPRRRESRLLEALYRTHPRFGTAPVWSDAAHGPMRVEGGDVMVAGDGRVVVGISERTSAVGAARLAEALLAAGAAGQVTTVRIPRGAGFHLDLVMTMVDRDALALWRPVRHALRAHCWRRRSGGVSASALSDPIDGFPRPMRVIEIDTPRVPGHGRLWDHGVNVLALAPGVVVAYADNERANERLEEAGVEVLRVPGAALGQGRGGPRCLSCPLLRVEDGG